MRQSQACACSRLGLWRATVAAILPLALTSVVCEALMVLLGIGVKVATLPVVALGVGIGVDYALYTIAVIIAYLHVDADLPTAARHARLFTGRVVMLTGFMLAIAVADLGVVAHQVSGRHGHSLGIHVRVEHGGRVGVTARHRFIYHAEERVGQHRGRAILNALARRYGGQTLAAGPFL